MNMLHSNYQVSATALDHRHEIGASLLLFYITDGFSTLQFCHILFFIGSLRDGNKAVKRVLINNKSRCQM